MVRALSNMLLVGAAGYKAMYEELSIKIEQAVQAIEAAGIRLIHKQHRIAGSTVFAIEDPHALMMVRSTPPRACSHPRTIQV